MSGTVGLGAFWTVARLWGCNIWEFDGRNF